MQRSSDWHQVRLEEVTVPTSTWQPKRDPRPTIKYVDVSAVSREELRIVAETEYSGNNAPSRARKIICSGDTIFATVRPTLRRIAQVPESLDGEIVSTAFCVLRSDPRVVKPDFLFFATQLDSVMENIAALETGASYPAVRDSDILNQQIPLPPISEQRDIASVLTAVRLALQWQGECVSTAVALKHATMRSLFTRGLNGEAQKETEIGLVPESWEIVSVGTVRERLQYGTSTRCSYEPTEFPVLRIPNIEPGRVNYEDLKFGRLRATEADRYRLKNGDLIFIRTNGVIERLGACAIYTGKPENALFASYLIRARLKLDQVDPHFMAYFFESELGTSIIAGRATPAADGKYNLNTGTIDALPLPLPPTLEEQRELVTILDAIDRKIDLHRKKRAVLDGLFKALLHKLMTGEIRVADLNLSSLPDIAPTKTKSIREVLV